MAYLRISEARAAGQAARSYIEDSRRFLPANRYDVFLSHSYHVTETTGTDVHEGSIARITPFALRFFRRV